MLNTPELEVVDPWSQSVNKAIARANSLPPGDFRKRRLRSANRRAAAANERGILQSDFIIAVLDGVDVDSGTASEIGFAAASGKRVIGLRTDFRRTGDNDAATVNLQVQYWIEKNKGAIYTTVDQLLRQVRRLASAG